MHLDSEAPPRRSSSPSHSLSNGSKITNGHSHGNKPESNGNSRHSNGTSLVRSLPPTWYGHDREEVARILIQSLNELGYHTSARSLSRESGFDLEGPTVAAFRSAVLHGEWPDAEALLFGDGPVDFADGVGTRASDSPGKESWSYQGLTLADGANRKEMLFRMRQQKYLELLESRDLGAALMVLRQELTPLHQDVSRLHSLSGLMMCQSAEDLKCQAQWDGAAGESRSHLLSDLSRSISPSVMIPEHRLGVLLDQVKGGWINNCLYHNTAASPSLYYNHTCEREDFPNRSIYELCDHKSEVWFLAFSNDGTRLATASQDKTVIIYDAVNDFRFLHSLTDHDAGVVHVSWSPDDSKLITCTREEDNALRVWETKTGSCIMQLTHFEAPTTVAEWCTDGESFVVGSLDTKHALELWNVDEELLYRWKETKLRVYDLAISPNGRRMVALLESKIVVYDFTSREKLGEYMVDDVKSMTSVSISRDSKMMLISMNPNKTRLMLIDTGEIIQSFEGNKQAKFMIRSSFGGASESFVVSGSEDSLVYIWRTTGQLTETLVGHRHDCVNAVTWHPKNPAIFASAGDDSMVRIWSTDNYIASKGLSPLSNGFGRAG